jgi:hypothetical protein
MEADNPWQAAKRTRLELELAQIEGDIVRKKK